jgi:acyl dehydratase
VDRVQIARYAGASGDYNPLYVDEVFAKNAGFPAALAPGMLGMGFLAELAVDWLRGARLRRFQARFVKIVWPGDLLTTRGRVVDRRFEGNGSYAADIELWAENQRGELVVRGQCTAQLYYSAEDETRQRAGQPPLLVTAEEEEARLAKLSRAQPARRPEAQPPRPGVPPTARPPFPAPLPPRPGAPPARPAAAPAPAARPAPAPAARPAAPAPFPKPARPARPAAKPRRAAKPARKVPPKARRAAGKAKPKPRPKAAVRARAPQKKAAKRRR